MLCDEREFREILERDDADRLEATLDGVEMDERDSRLLREAE